MHWANGGETKLSNLVTLCGFHHRLVHEGGYGITATDDGLPIGMQLVGRPFAEAMVLRVAGAYERSHGWATRRPASTARK